MNFLDSHRLLPCVVGLAISAVASVARLRDLRRVAHRASRPTAAPAQGLRRAARRLRPLVARPLPRAARRRQRPRHPVRSPAALAWALAGLALITAVAATRKTVPAFAGLAVDHAADRLRALGVRHAGPVSGDRRIRRVGPRLAVFFLATPLVGARPRIQARARSSAPCASAARPLCAVLLTLAASVSAEADPATVPRVGRGAPHRRPGRPRPGDASTALHSARSTTTSRRARRSAPRRRSTA